MVAQGVDVVFGHNREIYRRKVSLFHFLRSGKANSQRAKRELEKREPKIFENDKNTMFIRGGRTSETVNEVLKDIYSIKKPLGLMFNKKNITRPIDDPTSVEFFSNRSDCSMFMFGSHSKKRPHNLVVGRLFDGQILDMIELAICNFKSMALFSNLKVPTGTKPCLLFNGPEFDEDTTGKKLKNILIDFFRGMEVKNIRLAGLEHVLSFTLIENRLLLRSYKIILKKSGVKTPRVELEEMGPSLDLSVRRTHFASDDLYKRALKRPKTAKPKKKKNIAMNPLGSQLGRIHMQKQDFSKLQTRKTKALKVGDFDEASGRAAKRRRIETGDNDDN